MSNKTTIKDKGKTASVAVATSAKKPAGISFVKMEKPKFTYNLPQPQAARIREETLDYAVAPTAGFDTTPQDQETELADKLVLEVGDDSADVGVLCETYQLKREELGRLTGFSVRALAEWAAGKLPSQPAKRRLQEVRRLLDALAQIVKPERIPKWLHQRNPAFDQLTPLQVIELGEIDRLWAMVHDLGSGQPG